VKLLDFGVARIADAGRITATGTIIGTPNFVAPEVVRGAEATPQSDVWSAGVLLWEMLTGRRAYEGSITEVFGAILGGPPIPIAAALPDLPGAVVAALDQALGYEVEERFASARAFRAALSSTTPRATMPPPRRGFAIGSLGDGAHVPSTSPTVDAAPSAPTVDAPSTAPTVDASPVIPATREVIPETRRVTPVPAPRMVPRPERSPPASHPKLPSLMELPAPRRDIRDAPNVDVTPSVTHTPAPTTRMPWILSGIVAVILLAVALVGFVVFGSEDEAPPRAPTHEARAYLDEHNRLERLAATDARAFVDAVYAAGATRVEVVAPIRVGEFLVGDAVEISSPPERCEAIEASVRRALATLDEVRLGECSATWVVRFGYR